MNSNSYETNRDDDFSGSSSSKVSKEDHKYFREIVKKDIQDSYDNFKENNENYHKWQKFIYKSTLSDEQKTQLHDLNKPDIETNIIESFISRQVGEFVKHQPSIIVEPDDSQVDPTESKISSELIEAIDAHLRYKFSSQDENGMQVGAFTNLLSGGFSGFELWTDYIHEMSFDQEIYFSDFKTPTLFGFDPLALLPTKSDGRYCFKLYPMSKDDFKRQYPKADIDDMTFTRNPKMGSFSWAYQNNNGPETLMVGKYFVKKKKRTKIVKLVNGSVITQKKYNDFLKFWEDQKISLAPPSIIGKPRWTNIETIYQYIGIENQCLECTETDFPGLPFIFMDGNSKWICDSPGNKVAQFTRTYLYQALGMQRMKNFSAQCLGSELINMVAHKYIMSIESVPERPEYLDIIKKPQYAGIVLYNKYANDDPNRPLDPPIPVPRVPCPPEVTQTFQLMDSAIQQALGTYDAALGINDNQLSGSAIIAGATQSNPASMPYMVGYLQAFEHLLNMYVQMLPLYWKGARKLPIIDKEGNRKYIDVNKEGALKLKYSKNALRVKVSPGVNYEIQKNVTLKMIDSMMRSSEIFNEFINTMCLEDLLDNMPIRGITQMKEKSKKFMKMLEEKKKSQEEMQKNMPNPLILKAQADQMKAQAEMQKMQLNAKDSEADNQLKLAELQLKSEQLEQEKMKIFVEMSMAGEDKQMAREKLRTERLAKATDLAIEHAKHAHNRELEGKQHDHKVNLETSQHLHQVRMDEENLKNSLIKKDEDKIQE